MTWKGAGRGILKGERYLLDGFLCLMLMTMVILACLQIALRTFFDGGLLWADPLLRYLVLWCGLLGGVVATREGKHISIDVVGYLAPDSVKPWIALFIDLFSLAVTAVLTRAAVTFVVNEREFGTSVLLQTPSWIWNLIFPLAFGLITFHFLLIIATDIRALISRPVTTDQGEDS